MEARWIAPFVPSVIVRGQAMSEFIPVAIPLTFNAGTDTFRRNGPPSVIDQMVLVRKTTTLAMGASAREKAFRRIGSNASFPPTPALRRDRLNYGAHEATLRKWSQARKKRRTESCSRSLWNMSITVLIGAFTYVLWVQHYSLCNDGMSDCLNHYYSRPG